jgi:hypothetical protein
VFGAVVVAGKEPGSDRARRLIAGVVPEVDSVGVATRIDGVREICGARGGAT